MIRLYCIAFAIPKLVLIKLESISALRQWDQNIVELYITIYYIDRDIVVNKFAFEKQTNNNKLLKLNLN